MQVSDFEYDQYQSMIVTQLNFTRHQKRSASIAPCGIIKSFRSFLTSFIGSMSPGVTPASLPNTQQIEKFITSLLIKPPDQQTLIELLRSSIDSYILDSQAETGQSAVVQNTSLNEETTRASLACKVGQAAFRGERQYIDSSTDSKYYTERVRVHR